MVSHVFHRDNFKLVVCVPCLVLMLCFLLSLLSLLSFLVYFIPKTNYLAFVSNIAFTIMVLSHCNTSDTMADPYFKMLECENNMKHQLFDDLIIY